MRYYLEDVHHSVIAQNLDTQCAACLRDTPADSTRKIKCPMAPGLRRAGHSSSTISGSAFLCSDADIDLKSARVLRTNLQVLLDASEHIKSFKNNIASTLGHQAARLADELNQQTRRLVHNLTSLNAHNIQEIYDFLPQDLLTRRLNDQFAVITQTIKSDPHRASKLFLRLTKNNLAMKTEFSVFRRLHEAATPLKLIPHKVRSVVLNVLHTFFSDFTDKDVRVHVADFTGSLLLDYETFQGAIYLLVDNAAKYVMPHSSIEVQFLNDGQHLHIVFEMMSLRILDKELARLTDEGYSGEFPRSLGISGDGIGLHRTCKLLSFNHATLIIKNNLDRTAISTSAGATYEKNHFTIAIPLRS